MAKQRKLKRYKFSITLCIFLVILVYIAVHLFAYIFKSTIDVYEVKVGKVTDVISATGVAVREEKTVKSSGSGYISFFCNDVTKVAKGETVYTLASDDKIKKYIAEMVASDKDAEQNNTDAISEEIETFQSEYNTNDFESVYNTKQNLDTMVLSTNQSYIKKALKKLNKDGNNYRFDIGKSDASGVVSFMLDNFTKTKVSKVTEDDMDESKYKVTSTASLSQVESGDGIYRIVTGENWKLIVPVDEDDYKELKKHTAVDVTFEEDSVTTDATVKTKKMNGKYYAILSMNKCMVRYINERFLDIEIVLKSDDGFKVPKSAVLAKDFYQVPIKYLSHGANEKNYTLTEKVGNGHIESVSCTIYRFHTYYKKNKKHKYKEYDDAAYDDYFYIAKDDVKKGTVLYTTDDTKSDSLELKNTVREYGVYCINSGYASFRAIEIIRRESDYDLIRSDTKHGVSLYDHIAEKYKEVSQDKVIY